jgi:hypothetical protein
MHNGTSGSDLPTERLVVVNSAWLWLVRSNLDCLHRGPRLAPAALGTGWTPVLAGVKAGRSQRALQFRRPACARRRACGMTAFESQRR